MILCIFKTVGYVLGGEKFHLNSILPHYASAIMEIEDYIKPLEWKKALKDSINYYEKN